MAWIQREIRLPPYQKGCHPVTHEVLAALPELEKFQIGLLNVFIRHTSASLTLNENADPDVPADLEKAINSLAPEDFPYTHTIEGPDDMPAHLKVALTDASLTIPISAGRLCLGTWQGIFLWEHRRQSSGRRITLTVQGETD